MPDTLSRPARAVAVSVSIILACCSAAQAQQKKGDREISFFSGGFFISVDETGFKDSDLSGTGVAGRTSGYQSFNVGGLIGYFLTRHNEIGGGTFLSFSHAKFCLRSFEDGKLTGESCDSSNYFAMGLDGFYRYHFGREGAKRAFFAGADLFVGDVTRNHTGNIRVRPHVGYRYFLEKKVSLDFSVGYNAELNKKNDGYFQRDRQGWISGQLGLSFIF